jgi:TadE-like protein
MRNLVSLLWKFVTDRSGTMTIEFVAIVPIFVVTLIFGFEFGRAFWAFDVVARDVRAGVRYLSRNATTPPPYGSDACPGSARNMVETGSPSLSLDASKHFPWKGATATFQCPSQTFDQLCPSLNDCGLSEPGSVVTMTATVPISLSVIYILNRMLDLSGANQIQASIPLTVSYQERYIGN